jgi:hypothetical protein
MSVVFPVVAEPWFHANFKRAALSVVEYLYAKIGPRILQLPCPNTRGGSGRLGISLQAPCYSLSGLLYVSNILSSHTFFQNKPIRNRFTSPGTSIGSNC